MKHVVSIDVEDWYHPLDPDPATWSTREDRIVDSTTRLLDIFDETRTKGTFFFLGYVAERHPELVRETARRGHEIGTHGYWHRFIYQQSPDEFGDDLRRSIDALSPHVGVPIAGYRAPYFSITKKSLWALDVIRDAGLRYDSSIFPVVNHRYGIPDAPRLPYTTDNGVFEAPVSTYPLGTTNFPCGGGAYFRILPYFVLRRMYRKLEARGEPIVFYLHPWEIDCGPRPIRIPLTLRARHHYGLSRTADKLRWLLREFRFGSFREVFFS